MKKILKKLKEKKGFTLVESVVAIGVLAIASLAFSVFLSTSTRMTLLTMQNEQDYADLQEAMSTIEINDDITEGTIIVNGRVLHGKIIDKLIGEDGNPVVDSENKPIPASFTIDFTGVSGVDPDDAVFVVKGKYFLVENTETGQHFATFVPDSKSKIKNEADKKEDNKNKDNKGK